MTKAPNEGNILPVGNDGDSGEAVELAPYVYVRERTQNGVTKSCKVLLCSSYPGLAHTSQKMNTIRGDWGLLEHHTEYDASTLANGEE